MTSWGESLRPPPQRRPRPAEHKGFGAERRGQRRRLSRSVPNFPRRGGSSDGAIAGRRSNLRAGRRVFPVRPPPPRAHCSRVHVVRRRFENSSEPECGWTGRLARRQVGEPRSIASRRAGRGLQAVARPAAASGCATARGNGSRATNHAGPHAVVEPFGPKLPSTQQLRGSARSSRGATCGAGRRAFAATRRQSKGPGGVSSSARWGG